jgi:glycosyltransferase involved in cell wall biosynthesis
MKVLFIHHGSVPGGAPVSLLNILRGLRQLAPDIEAKVLCTRPQMKPFFENGAGVPVADLYSPVQLFGRLLLLGNWSNPKTVLLALLELAVAPYIVMRQVLALRRERPDVVHLNSSILVWTAVASCLLSIRVVWHVREVASGGPHSLRRKLLKMWITRLAGDVICISEAEALALGATGSKVHIIYNFENADAVAASRTDGSAARGRLGIRPEVFVALSLGGVSFRKGTVELIQAARHLGNIEVLMAGPPLLDREVTRYDRLILRLEDFLIRRGLRSHYEWRYQARVRLTCEGGNQRGIHWLGHVGEVGPLIDACNCLVFAGTTPQFPRPVYEAWLRGKPVAVLPMLGVSDNVTHLWDGVIADDTSAASLAGAIAATKPEMGPRGYVKALERFSMRKNVPRLVNIYRQASRDQEGTA